jgi:endonuclease-3
MSKKNIKQLEMLKKYSSNIRLAAEKWDKPWKTLITTILSARSRDEKTISVAKGLYKKYPSLKKLSRANLKEVQEIIKPINFYKSKSKNIVECAKVLVENGGKVPRDFSKLIKLPGVGRKTANVFLSEIGEDCIGVDTHVSYISQKLRWTKNNKPEKIEEDLKRLFPKKYWRKINPILVKFGKTYTSRRKKNDILDIIRRVH